MDGKDGFVEDLQRKIERLEKENRQLRISRQMLMHLVEAIQKEALLQIRDLEREMMRLRSKNKKYAKGLIEVRWR